MIVTARQMQACEDAALARGITAADLMEEAGRGIAGVIRQFFPAAGTLVLYLGKGNNAGDALVAARELVKDGWQVFGRLSGPVEEMKELPRRHFGDWVRVMDDARNEEFPRSPLVLLDGLLGIGFSGEMKPELVALAREIKELREARHARVVAMDLPSGLGSKHAVEADITACVAQIKDLLVEDGADRNVGRIALVPVKELSRCEGDAAAAVMTPRLIRSWLPHRANDAHKGDSGRVCVLAGSRGFLGAAELACRGAVRAGAGLTTLLVKDEVYELLASRVPPEVMVARIGDYREVLDMKADALCIGPGLGFEDEKEVLEVMRRCRAPAVVDADALTMLSRRPDELDKMNGLPRLLTPHPGEMQRLLAHFPGWHGMDRRTLAEMFVKDAPGRTLLLKGARTVVSTAGEVTLFNSTGHSGMASGGMGDVLAGVCAALAGQRLPLHRAAGLGAWLCGRAAELAGREGLCAGDVPAHLGAALRDLKAPAVF
ncbi:MAG: NAD(P)H-hydrate dehydratase [Verrucomicrobiaceae bacterium]|nr:NAD(P)H-hydrate dehydratase [Verrucomicrobiaceae bacterium]